MSDLKQNNASNLRIIWAIALNDIMDGFKNKAILSGMGTVLFLILLYKLLPSLYRPSRAHLVFYDAGQSTIVSTLDDSSKYRLQAMDTMAEFTDRFGQGDNGKLGLVLATDSYESADAAEPYELDGYVLWANRLSADDLKMQFEQELSEITGRPVRIRIAGTVKPQPDTMGSVRTVSVTLVVTVFFMALLTVPNLMFEEKTTRTLEALLISPARVSQVVMAKALAGLVYCTLAAGIAVLINWVVVVSWGLLLLAWLWGTLFSVALGLAMGFYFESRQQIGGWLMLVGNLLLVPAFLIAIEPILPEGLRNILPWMPMAALSILFRYAFSTGANAAQILTPLSVLIGASALMLAFVVWKVRRIDQ